MDYLLDYLIVLVVVVISIVLHELAHGVVAMWNGDDTARRAGRLTLNPISHFDTVGFLMLAVLHFGYAKPVPVNPNNFRNKNMGMFTVSIAGITINLLLAFICYPLLFITYDIPYLYTFVVYMVLINLNLAIFNLLPLYPLDGYRIVNCVVPSQNKVLTFLRKYSRYILIVLFGMGIIRDILNLPLFFDPLSWIIQKVSYALMNLYKMFWGMFFR